MLVAHVMEEFFYCLYVDGSVVDLSVEAEAVVDGAFSRQYSN